VTSLEITLAILALFFFVTTVLAVRANKRHVAMYQELSEDLELLTDEGVK